MKMWVKIVLYVIFMAGLAVSITASIMLNHHNQTLRRQVRSQGVIIDSLLRRRMSVFDIELYVTDKSRAVIYGRYNKGTIFFPMEKKYIVSIDSSNILMRAM